MNQENKSRVAEFVLLGLSSSYELQYFFFMLFNFLYIIIVLGNLLIVLTVISEPALHTPMYIMLSNLSILDVFLATYATPKMIHDFLHEPKTISFEGCMAQIFLLHVFAGGEMVLLVAMAYDRYVAICKPLHYATIMNLRKCTGLVVGSWVIGVMHSLSQLAFTVNLPFCGPNVVNSYYCDLTLVIKLACTDTYVPEVLMLLDSGLMGGFILALAGLLHSHPGHCTMSFLNGHDQGPQHSDCPHHCGYPFFWALYLHLCLAFQQLPSG